LAAVAARAQGSVAVAVAEAAQGAARIAAEAAQRAAEALQEARGAGTTRPEVATRAAVRAQRAAAQAQEAADEVADDLRLVAVAPTPDPTPGWFGRMRQRSEARVAFERGKELYVARDLVSARPYLEQAVRLDSEHDEARALLGWLEYFSGSPQSAIAMFKTALRRQPTWEGSYNGLGWSRLRLDRPYLARDAFRAALDANPQYTDALAGLGLALYESGDYVAAVAALDQAVATLESALGRGAPELVDLREATAWSLYHLGRYGEAAVEFERVVRARPGGPSLQVALGWAYLKGGRRGDARTAFQRALELAPDSKEAARGLVLATQ
jgi:tetratricopeptide (TPR) repeat protein